MELGPTAYVILGILHLGAHSGYDIKQLADFSTRHFWATRCGVVPERTNDSSCALAASSTDRAVAVGNMTRLNHGQLMLSIVMWDGTLV